MTIPFVIDNQQHIMASVLNDLLAHHKGHSLDIATAYFNVGGWQLLREGLKTLGNFRLLLGDEPEAGSDLGLREIGAKPIKGLLLGLVESLSQKIASIDSSGFLDTSILGEVVHPQNFNTLRRIEQEDGKVVEEQEQFAELVSSEFLLQSLKNLLDAGMRKMLEDLPDGIHSGLAREGAKGIFFYFTAPVNGTSSLNSSHSSRQHFWRYIDLTGDTRGGRIEDNRYVITNLIQCQFDTPRIVPVDGEVDIFNLQEKVIASMVQSSVEQAAVEEAPKQLDPIQQTVATILRSYINSPAINRKEVIAAIQQLNAPLPNVYIKTLRKAYEAFTANMQIDELLTTIQSISQEKEKPATALSETKTPVRREDLKLICFDYLWQ